MKKYDTAAIDKAIENHEWLVNDETKKRLADLQELVDHLNTELNASADEGGRFSIITTCRGVWKLGDILEVKPSYVKLGLMNVND